MILRFYFWYNFSISNYIVLYTEATQDIAVNWLTIYRSFQMAEIPA